MLSIWSIVKVFSITSVFAQSPPFTTYWNSNPPPFTLNGTTCRTQNQLSPGQQNPNISVTCPMSNPAGISCNYTYYVTGNLGSMFTSRGGSRTFNIEAPGPGMQPGSRDLQHNSEHISIQPNPNNLHADIQDALNEKCQELANNASTRVYTTWRHEGVGANLDCSYREISNQGQDEITKMEMTCYPGQTGTRIQCSYGMDMRREVTTTPNRTSRTLPLLGVAIERLSPAPRAPLPQTQSTAPQASINRLSIAISEYKEEANRTIQIHNHREERTVSTATPQNFREMATSWMRDNCRASTAAANRAQNAPPEPAPAPADAR